MPVHLYPFEVVFPENSKEEIEIHENEDRLTTKKPKIKNRKQKKFYIKKHIPVVF